MAKYNFYIICFWFLVQFSFGQETSFNPVLESFEKNDYLKVHQELYKIDTSKVSTYDKATWLFYLAEYYNDIDKHALAYQNVLASKKIFQTLNQTSDVSDCNMLAISILNHQNNLIGNENLTNKYIQEEIDYLEGESESLKLANVYFSLGNRYVMSDDRNNAFLYYNKAKDIYNKESDSLSIADCFENMATSYLTINPVMVDSSLYYCKLSEKVYTNLKNNYALAVNYNNQSRIYKKLKDYQTSITYLLKADSLPISENVNKTKLIFYENLSELYGVTKNFKQQSYYLNKQLELRNDINDLEQNISISEIEEKYQNEKLRADNLEIEAKNTQNRNIAFGLGGSLALGSIIVFLVYKNKKRKQELILQNKEIKEKELTAKLKEQELASINAMIEGQEKERLRIANDLHDDLGSHMATIKMYFSSFKDQDSKNLFDKTNTLIEEAYQKIRNIAHTKNSGVLAKQGFLKAVKDLAGNISKSEQVKVKVYDNGLDQRLENSLELTLFRIIQELIANVIKHADATEVDIHLSEEEGMLSIMVEDNGKGFDASQITTKNKGMGLSSIDRRVEDLDGKMIVESQPNSGTSVIIDLPL